MCYPAGHYTLALSGSGTGRRDTAGITCKGDPAALTSLHREAVLAIRLIHHDKDYYGIPYCFNYWHATGCSGGKSPYPGGLSVALYGSHKGGSGGIIYHFMSDMDQLG